MNKRATIIVGIDIRLIGKQRTGDETVFFQLVRELIRRCDARLHYELFTDEKTDDRLAALRLKLGALGREDIEIISLPTNNRFLWNAVLLPWRLWRHPIDVFHTQYILPFFLSRRLKIVTHMHDVSFRAHPEWIKWTDRLFLGLLIPRSMTRSDVIVTPSEFTRVEIMRYYQVAPTRIMVIPNAAALEWFIDSTPEELTRVTEKYGLTPGRYLLSSGTMQPRKNIPFLIAAFRQANHQHTLGLTLALTGNQAGHNVDTEIAEMDQANIVSVGYVSDEDLRHLVAGARGYVLPSLYEGFGIPIEEALAKKTPVLVSDIPVFREVGGERVDYFDPTHLASLADSLYNFTVINQSGMLREKQLRSGKRKYSWAESAEKLAHLYQSLIDAPH